MSELLRSNEEGTRLSDDEEWPLRDVSDTRRVNFERKTKVGVPLQLFFF